MTAIEALLLSINFQFSVHIPNLSLDNSQEDHCHEILIRVASKFLEKEVTYMAMNFNSNVIESVEDYEDWHGHIVL